ncbi:hypothetical protein ERX35_005175 [Macrococcus equipercicus]|uniref:CYTH domain-containing protein n=1 Tax=Macrococcus equipercicus TaxID=69967 RepID=A0ABQ6R8L1_9STAP|nr:hypothetical protein [Macrococcus equipercicus]KAA1039472.1 hypothetical protein ERX35_005175 [Macrococcus equipercicus]
MISSYEVKVYANRQALSKKGKIASFVLEAFNAKKKDEDFLVQFIDHDKTHYMENMTYRIRKSEDEDIYQLQFKKRYPVTASVDEAVSQAEQDGFKDGSFEIEYGAGRQTLSVYYEAEVSAKDHVLPDLATSHLHLKEQVHDAFKTYLNTITAPSIIGPIEFERHIGRLDDYKIKLEKWDIKDKHIIELSAKVLTEQEARKLQQLLIEKLQSLHVYEPEDQLKTTMIFNHY